MIAKDDEEEAYNVSDYENLDKTSSNGDHEDVDEDECKKECARILNQIVSQIINTSSENVSRRQLENDSSTEAAVSETNKKSEPRRRRLVQDSMNSKNILTEKRHIKASPYINENFMSFDKPSEANPSRQAYRGTRASQSCSSTCSNESEPVNADYSANSKLRVSARIRGSSVSNTCSKESRLETNKNEIPLSTEVITELRYFKNISFVK